jgi:hypothetical protein
MTVTAKVPPPVPPNSNMDRGMFVWISSVGGSGTADPLSTDAKMQSLLDFCASNGVNVLFLDMYRYLGASNWDSSNAHAATVAKFIHYAHASGIRVFALAGDVSWGQNQQWVAANIIKALAQFNEYANATSAITNEAGSFDGLIFDVEYWTQQSYTAADPEGLCDLMNAARRVLNIPVGCAATQWLADGTSAALTFTYKGVSQLEGLHLIDQSDFVAVMCYSNNNAGTDGATQIAMFSNWYNYASTTANKQDQGLFCVSNTQTGQPAGQSYNGETKAKMEQNHTAISTQYVPASATNMSFRGQAIQDYASYSTMS